MDDATQTWLWCCSPLSNNLSRNLIPFAGFMGTDRLQIFVQGMRMQAAARATEPPKADFGMAIQVAWRQQN